MNAEAHLLVRDETGAIIEPVDSDRYDGDPEIMFEREFHRMLSPWTTDDLKLECEDCDLNSEQVSPHYFQGISHNFKTIAESETANLCDKCHEKRMAERSKLISAKHSDDTEGDNITTQTNGVLANITTDDLSTPEKCQETIQRILTAQAEDQLSATQARAMIGAVNNCLRLLNPKGASGKNPCT